MDRVNINLEIYHIYMYVYNHAMILDLSSGRERLHVFAHVLLYE